MTDKPHSNEYASLIIEGLLITQSPDGVANLSPMGVRFNDDGDVLLLRPFKSSRSYRNLQQVNEAVFHVTDDVNLIAHAALDDISPMPPMTPLKNSLVNRLSDTCRWYLLRVKSIDDEEMRATMEMRVISQGRVRDFSGFNRAKHAVIEAAIDATRVGIIQDDKILNNLASLHPLVQKTGGLAERAAFKFINDRVESLMRNKTSGSHTGDKSSKD